MDLASYVPSIEEIADLVVARLRAAKEQANLSNASLLTTEQLLRAEFRTTTSYRQWNPEELALRVPESVAK